MIGHEHILRQRLERLPIRTVFVDVGLSTSFERRWLSREAEDLAPSSIITDGTSPALADLRCLHGLTVILSSRCDDAALLWQWFDAIVAVQPLRVFIMLRDECLQWPE